MSTLANLERVTRAVQNNEDVPANSVPRAAIEADAVDGTKIADDSINSEHYVDGSIDNAHLANNSVNTAKIVNGAVTIAKLPQTNLNNSRFLRGDGQWADAGGVPSITAVGSYVFVRTSGRNNPYNPNTTHAFTGGGNETYGAVFGTNVSVTSGGDFNQAVRVHGAGNISGGTWRSLGAGVSNQFCAKLFVRVS